MDREICIAIVRISGVSHLAGAVPLSERKIDGYLWRAEKHSVRRSKDHTHSIYPPTTTRVYP